MTYEEVWQAIEKFAVEHGMSCPGVAKGNGLDATGVNKIKRWSKCGQQRWPSSNSISKILSATDTDLRDFTKHMGH